MATRKLQKGEWRPFLDRMSKVIAGSQAEIAIDSLALGHQIEAEWLPLLGIAYDPKDDLVEVALEGVDHMISHPREIYVDDGGPMLNSLEIVDDEGTRQVIQLRRPLMLAPPSH